MVSKNDSNLSSPPSLKDWSIKKVVYYIVLTLGVQPTARVTNAARDVKFGGLVWQSRFLTLCTKPIFVTKVVYTRKIKKLGYKCCFGNMNLRYKKFSAPFWMNTATSYFFGAQLDVEIIRLTNLNRPVKYLRNLQLTRRLKSLRTPSFDNRCRVILFSKQSWIWFVV